MLKNPIIVFGIKTTTNEYSGPVLRELFDTLKDALDNTTRFSNAYCPPGFCTIDRLVIDGRGPNGMHAVERWTICGGGVDKRELLMEDDK